VTWRFAPARRSGAVVPSIVALLALTIVAGCSGSSAHRTSARSATTVALGPTGPAGSDCLTRLRRAGAATLAARSLTLDQAAWREHPAGATVSGGGAAVITYQAPNRYHVVPTGSTHGAAIEQTVIGGRAWQGSASAGWVRYTTHQPIDPLRWLRIPGRAAGASWSGDACAFTAKVAEGTIRGRAQIDAHGHLLAVTMTLVSHGHTIEMVYRVSRVGSSPTIDTPRA
jgi:hypothetical protein